MFFKNLSIYRLDAGWLQLQPSLADALEKHPLPPITALAIEARGWSPRVLATDNAEQISLLRDYRNIPAAAVRRQVAERLREHEQRNGFCAGRKLARGIRDEVIARMTPSCPVQRAEYQAVVDRQAQILIINSATPARADDLTHALRNALGSLPATPLTSARPMPYLLTRWLAGHDLPAGFQVDRECQLVAPDESKSTVRFVRHALGDDDVTQHLRTGKLATCLAMTWRDRLAFVIDDKVRIRKLQLLDSMRIAENRGELDGEMAEQADLALMVGELRDFVSELAHAIGAEGR